MVATAAEALEPALDAEVEIQLTTQRSWAAPRAHLPA
eukprot:COSAG02_NODE_32477_length_515_cov_1.225962_1_plen_36_part_01